MRMSGKHVALCQWDQLGSSEVVVLQNQHGERAWVWPALEGLHLLLPEMTPRQVEKLQAMAPTAGHQR